MSNFKPIFVVGHPRSGTTMLASMLGRHTSISMPPETMFFYDVYGDCLSDRESYVDKAMASKRIQDLGLDREELLQEFDFCECSMKGLLQSLLSLYCRKSGKVRPGEKTPLHLLWISTIVEWFPEAKIVCIVRDGRDVISSLLNVPWSHDNIYKHCFDWKRNILLVEKLSSTMPGQFMFVKYEDILFHPERELKKVCHFISEEFQPAMLENKKSGAVPNWEKPWKEKALKSVDKSNCGKWKRQPACIKGIMNTLMVGGLKRMNYSLEDVSLLLRLKCWVNAWPYHPWVRPFFSKLKWSIVIFLRKK